MTDFEQQLQKFFRTVFPGVDNSGCLFHFNQAVLRNVNKCQAFVPVQDIPAAWDATEYPNTDEFNRFVTYF